VVVKICSWRDNSFRAAATTEATATEAGWSEGESITQQSCRCGRRCRREDRGPSGRRRQRYNDVNTVRVSVHGGGRRCTDASAGGRTVTCQSTTTSHVTSTWSTDGRVTGGVRPCPWPWRHCHCQRRTVWRLHWHRRLQPSALRPPDVTFTSSPPVPLVSDLCSVFLARRDDGTGKRQRRTTAIFVRINESVSQSLGQTTVRGVETPVDIKPRWQVKVDLSQKCSGFRFPGFTRADISRQTGRMLKVSIMHMHNMHSYAYFSLYLACLRRISSTCIARLRYGWRALFAGLSLYDAPYLRLTCAIVFHQLVVCPPDH